MRRGVEPKEGEGAPGGLRTVAPLCFLTLPSTYARARVMSGLVSYLCLSSHALTHSHQNIPGAGTLVTAVPSEPRTAAFDSTC